MPGSVGPRGVSLPTSGRRRAEQLPTAPVHVQEYLQTQRNVEMTADRVNPVPEDAIPKVRARLVVLSRASIVVHTRSSQNFAV